MEPSKDKTAGQQAADKVEAAPQRGEGELREQALSCSCGAGPFPSQEALDAHVGAHANPEEHSAA